jgi:membrane protease YdiL (CAAX protease family)
MTASGLWATLTAAPPDDATKADRQTVTLVGLELPIRATVAIAVVVFAVLLDYTRMLGRHLAGDAARLPDGARAIAVERLILYGLVPLAVVVLAFRDRPGRNALTRGDWRVGLPLLVAGLVVMTPVVLWYATLPDVRAFYAPSSTDPLALVITNAIDLTSVEYAFRGFLMLVLVRAIGPFGVLVATLPFVFGHLGKPELELFSTLGGGLVYGWLAWRTRSILWGSIGHTYIVTLVILSAASGGSPG